MSLPSQFAKILKQGITKKMEPSTYVFKDNYSKKKDDPPKLLKFSREEGKKVEEHWKMVEENWKHFSAY